MKVKHYFIIVGLSIIAFVALMNYKPTTTVSTSFPTQIKFGVMQIITVNKITPVEVEIFDGENQSEVVIGAMDEKTPYTYYYNRGLSNEDKGLVPAHKDWNRLGFKPNLQKPGMVKVELSLPPDAPMESAQLYYIIKKK